MQPVRKETWQVNTPANTPSNTANAQPEPPSPARAAERDQVYTRVDRACTGEGGRFRFSFASDN
jgi:hypothetical protein